MTHRRTVNLLAGSQQLGTITLVVPEAYADLMVKLANLMLPPFYGARIAIKAALKH